MGTASDAELVAASRRGERAAFGELVTRYQGVVCAVGYSGTRDRALSEDVAQDTFLAAWRQLDQLRETERLGPWLCGIARNLARKARKKSDREQPVDEPPVATDGTNPFDTAAEAETERVVRDALERVPDTYREVLVLYYHEHRSIRDVAEALKLSEAAVMQRLSRGRHYLADGVHDLVERALRGSPSKKNLAAVVLAALPALAPSHADAASTSTSPLTTTSKGPNMLKLALLAAGTIAVGTTAVVVQQTTRSDEPAPQVAAAVEQPRTAAHQAMIGKPAPLAHPPGQHAIQRGPAPTMQESDETADKVVDRATYERLHLDQGPSHGPANAPVTVTVFTDMQCPYCVKLVATLDQIEDEMPDKVRVVVKQFPVHTAAKLAAEATYAADAQGKFWELYNLMYAHQDDLSQDAILDYAQQAGLDVGKLRDALDKHTYAGALAADQAVGKELEVRGTPSFLINGKKYTGALPVETVREYVKAALAAK